MLKQKALSGLSWDIFGSISLQLIRFIISIFLARLLTPEQFGFVGIGLVFITIFQVFTDLGFAASLIQNKHNSKSVYNTVFYINLISGLIIFLIFQLSADLIGEFYESKEVENIVRLLSFIFIISSTCIIHRTILTRKLDFKSLTIRSIFAQIFGGLIGIYLAFNDYGVYSLVFQHLVASILDSIILWRLVKWYPSLNFSIKETSKLLNFGAYIFFDGVFSKIFQRLDILFIGKVFNPSILGYYTRAQTLNNLITKNSSKSLTKIFFPVMSKLQDDLVRFEQVYFRAVSVISFIAFASTGVFYILGKDLILILFGPQWHESVPIFKIIVLTAFSYPINAIMVNAFLGLGKAKDNMVIGIFRKSVQLLPLIIGYFYGLSYFLIYYVGVVYLITIVNVIYLKSKTGFSAIKHFKIFAQGLIPLIIMLIVQNFITNEMLHVNIIFATIFTIFYIVFNYLLKNQGLIYGLDNLKKVYNKSTS